MSVKLSLSNLERLPPEMTRPAYARSGLKAGIVHFGLGNFHRAHQAVYLDDLFNSGSDREWAIVGAGVLDAEKPGRQRLREQDWLTTVVEQDAGHSQARVIGSMVDFIEPGDAEAVIAKLADPAIRIVSTTITEGGYFIDPATQNFDAGHPDIIADAACPDQPKTVFGLILAGLKARRKAGTQPFTVMCCDNIPHNGHVTSNVLVGLAALSDGELATWIKANVAFPNSMVDRITPATTDRERAAVRDKFGVEDNWPVMCEPFRQWVLEDRFSSGRPALETVGVQFVPDVAPFELMKIRILNGGHAAIAYPAGLLDIDFVHEAMAHPLIGGYLAKLERREIIPAVPPVPGTDLNGYFALIEKRFSNPSIGDTIRRLCFDGSNRQPKFIIPSIEDRLSTGQSMDGLALVSALWCRYCCGVSDSGKVIEPNDPHWARLTSTARRSKDDPSAWLAMSDVYGDVGTSPVFAAAFATALRSLWVNGTLATLSAYIRAP
ncbi:mannitol dehydrogenase family protein [Microvirga sp. M2]|uniref:mannitol dehydrogenase family protein n=1 Tax=Microvirga sp. M2 TaxID=3073270 RepID=UPI0039C04132